MKEKELEIFKDIPEYEGIYQISNLGNVKSLYKNGKEIILKPSVSKKYLKVKLCKNNKCKTYQIHQLVAITFLKHKPNGFKTVVDHINNIRTDNRLENLQLISQRENVSKDIVDKTSNYIGVYWDNLPSKWKSQIEINYKKVHLGYFDDELEASKIYQLAIDNIEKYNNNNNNEFRKFLKKQL